MKTYFAHPISSYGTAEEKTVVAALEAEGRAVINPADRIHAQKVDEIRAAHGGHDAGAKVMDYFYGVCAACDACVFTAFGDGSLGAGVVGEVKTFLARGAPVQEARIEDGQAVLREVKDLSGYKCLDPQETRAVLKSLIPGRYGPGNKPPAP